GPGCPIPLEVFDWKKTRPPVVLDLWRRPPDPAARRFTTLATWHHHGKDIEFRGERYLWSKHMNFLRFIDLPRRTTQELELALETSDPTIELLLRENGWFIEDPF